MPRQPVVAVAASAGGVEALRTLVRALHKDLQATVLVALHLPAGSSTMLTEILGRVSALAVRDAVDGAPLLPGEVLVAQPDRHLLVVDGRVELGRGPRVKGHRPSHDVMLRSVALAHGSRAVGVVLTGLLADGAAGLAEVERHGGTCLVQDPAEAEFPSMPEHALLAVPGARALPLTDLAEEVCRVVSRVAAT